MSYRRLIASAVFLRLSITRLLSVLVARNLSGPQLIRRIDAFSWSLPDGRVFEGQFKLRWA